MSNFIEDCINGDALMSDIDDYIDTWHESDSEFSISDFLGMTRKEYALFVEDESYLGSIISAHKNKQNIVHIMRDQLSMVARSDDFNKSKKLQKWLENEKLWD